MRSAFPALICVTASLLGSSCATWSLRSASTAPAAAPSAPFDVTRDYSKAFIAYREAARQGNPESQATLGKMYQYGLGVPRDYTEAIKWYRLSTDQDCSAAQYDLSDMYYKGDGVPRDYYLAVKWCAKAADHGLAAAQYRMGVMNLNGEGMPRDTTEACKWLYLASLQGSAEAKQRLRLLKDSVKPAVLSEAERRASAFAGTKAAASPQRSTEDILKTMRPVVQ